MFTCVFRPSSVNGRRQPNGERERERRVHPFDGFPNFPQFMHAAAFCQQCQVRVRRRQPISSEGGTQSGTKNEMPY